MEKKPRGRPPKARSKALQDPEVQRYAAQAIVAGELPKDVAKSIGVHKTTMYNHINGENGNLQEVIEYETHRLMSSLPDAVQNVQDAIKIGIDPGNIKASELCLKASMRVLEAPGILSTTSQAHTVVNIINKTTNIMSPTISRLVDEMNQRVLEIPNPGEG